MLFLLLLLSHRCRNGFDFHDEHLIGFYCGFQTKSYSTRRFLLSFCVCSTQSEQNSVLKMVRGIFGPMILLLSFSLIHESKSIYFAFLRPKFISFSLFKKKREWMTKWYTVWNQITPRIRISLSLAKAQPFPAGLHILFSPFSSLLFGRNHLQKPIRNGWRWFPFIACSAANSLGNWSLWNIARDNTIRLGITFANSNKVAKITCTFFVWFNLLFIQSNKWQSERQKIDSHPFWNGTLLDDFFYIYIQLIDG